MNDQLQQALTEIIQKASGGIDAGVAFLSGEIPDVVNQLLMWKLVESILSVAVGIVLLFIAFRAAKFAVKEEERDICLQNHMAQIGAVCIAFFGCAFGLILASYAFNAVQILVAPKIYLIEYAASLAK